MLNVENMREKFESRSPWKKNRRKDGEYSDRYDRANWSLFQEAFTAGYQHAKEEQDSNLTCDQCCNELGMDDGSIRLCGECKGKEKHYETVIYSGEDLPPANTPVLALVISHEDPLLVGYCDEERKWYFHYENEYFDCDTYVQLWCYLPDFSKHTTSNNEQSMWVKVKDKEPDMDGYYLIYRGDGEYYHGAIDRAYYTPGDSTGTLIWLIYEDGVDDRVLDDDLYVRAPMPPGEAINDTQMS